METLLRDIKIFLLGKRKTILTIIGAIILILLLELPFIELKNTAKDTITAFLGAVFGILFTRGDEKFKSWFDKDIIDKYIIEDINNELKALKNETNWNNCTFNTFGFHKEFLIKYSEFYKYITFMADDLFVYEYCDESKGFRWLKTAGLHFKLVFRFTDYRDKEMRRKIRRSVFINIIIYSDDEELNNHPEDCRLLNDIILKVNEKLNPNFKRDKYGYDEVELDKRGLPILDDNFGNDKEPVDYKEVKTRKARIIRPAETWVCDFIAPEAPEATNDDFKRINRVLKNRLILFMEALADELPPCEKETVSIHRSSRKMKQRENTDM